jgi:hypothetical protein
VYALADYGSLELSEGSGNLEHQLSRRRSGIDRLLIEVQIDAARLQMLNRTKQINQRAPYSIDSPHHDHIEATPPRVLQHLIETGALVPALGSAYSSVAESLDNLPPSAHGNLGEPRNLILYRLPVCADADVQGGALHLGFPPHGANVAWRPDEFRPLISQQFLGQAATPFRMAA